MLISSAYAQTATGAAGASSLAGLIQFAPLILIVLVFYFMLLRPQQQQAKQLKIRQEQLTRGDKVITAGGVVGVVKKATDGAAEIDVEIAPNVVVSIVRSTISQIVSPAKADKADKADKA
ncbi:MAG: preprotein translocase subunit YajC [Acidocella sp. 20-57-95]|nr:MAG: preprotein translocase subunit YajC [Acidocella sp. 20-57-95]OYV59631.1 MAG: preprotein translocase subunit YajC [Acidocella sp. 21-58-7]HQT64677.1 preprotein translocase subunit YajC [Acidocella sp.]HQU04858.1 preprotein translocase subunit YajC [Acidocella sp.]